jgi:hypothetical protein
MTLLTIIQDVSLRLNLAVPATIIGNPDPGVRQLTAFSQDAGDEMAERWTWPNLRRPGALQYGTAPQIITGDGTTAIFPLPPAWSRFSPSDTFTSSLYPTLTLTGPVNEEDLLRFKQLPFTPLPSLWHLIGDPSSYGPGGQRYIEFYPAPASGEIISYVYGTDVWIASGTPPIYYTTWQTDADYAAFPERLVRLGTIWRWKRAKGLSYAEEFTMTERTFERVAGQQSQGRTIRTTVEPSRGDVYWPGTVTDLTSGYAEWT